MSDFQKYKAKRMENHPEFWENYEERSEIFQIGALLKQARKDAGLTQKQIADRLKTTKSVISRMENHATDIRLSTLEKFAKVLGHRLQVSLL